MGSNKEDDNSYQFFDFKTQFHLFSQFVEFNSRFYSFSQFLEFCSIFYPFLKMEKGVDEYTGQFIVLRTVYTSLVTLCTTPWIKTSAVTNQLHPNVFIVRAICLD